MAEALMKAGGSEWLARRRQGITATDITVIAGLVTWDSPWALYHRKRGDLPEAEQTDRMRLGSWLEESVIAEWERRRFMEHGGREHLLYASEARPWQLATPDMAGLGWVMEAKTSATRDGWGPDGSDEIPPHVRAQVLWQMDTLAVAEGHVAVVFLPSGEFRSYVLREDDALLADQMRLRTAGLEFQKRIMDGQPPPVDALTVTTAALRFIHPGGGGDDVAVLSPELVEGYDLSAQILKDARADHDRVRNEVREAMADSDRAVCGGEVVFRRTFTKVGGYTVAPYERDTIKRIGGE